MEENLLQSIALAKGATGKAAEAVVQQALSNPKTFVFGELLDEIQLPKDNSYYKLLELFAYGTLFDYNQQKASLPELNAQQFRKLQMLTLATLAAQTSQISYSSLMNNLQIPTQRQLEDLVIDCIYQNLIEAKLDHREQSVQILSSFGRDVMPDRVPELINQLESFLEHMNGVELLLDQQIEYQRNEQTRRQKQQEQLETEQAIARIKIQERMEQPGLFKTFSNMMSF